MDGIWALVVCAGVVCSAVPGSSQDSSRTLFLISSPEVVHAGTPTLLAITVLADFPCRVTAEMAHGNTKVYQTETFQGGLTSVLTLPPILGTTTADSPVNLTVRGYRENNLIFTNTTTLRFSPRNVSTFIQTDRSRYQPGDTVKVRVVSVQLDGRPYKGRVDISMQDPRGNVVDRWESTGYLGIVLWEFRLSQTIPNPLGQWVITTTMNGVTDVRVFTVEHYEHPHFEVLLKTPSHVLVGDDVSGSVRALYLSGQPVHGTLTVSVTLTPAVPDTASQVTLTQTKSIYGSTQFSFSNALLEGSSSGVRVAVCVTDNSTRFSVNQTVEVQRTRNTFQLAFHDSPSTLKPSLLFATKLRISRCDRKPLGAQDLTHSAVIEVTQRTSMMNTEPTTLILPVPEDGNIHIQFKLQEQVARLFIRARFQSSEETLTVYNNPSSPTGSYIQISPNDTLPAQIGMALQVDVKSTFQPTKLHFVVSSRGQVVAAGTKTSSSFSLTPTVSWSPEACVTVYCILSDGEVTMDTAHIPINQHNYGSLSWSTDKAQPGEQVSLTVTGLEPRSRLGIVVNGAHDDAPHADHDLKVEQECNIRILTNARLYQNNKPDGPTNDGDDLTVEKYWRHWMEATESLLWIDATVSNQTWTSGKITVPDGVASLRAFALVMSDNLSLKFTPVPQKLTVSKDFSLSLDVPSYIIRGEEIVLEVNVINHLECDIEVNVLLAQSEAFEFVWADKGDAWVVNSQKLIMGSHVSASALFPIRPVDLGEMEIYVDAVSTEASDSLVWRVLVKPEGVEQSFSESLFLEMAPVKYNSSRSVSFSFPPDVVAGSQRAHVALVVSIINTSMDVQDGVFVSGVMVVISFFSILPYLVTLRFLNRRMQYSQGDILALSIHNLDSLVQMPLGCGEQNMIHFAPCIYVIQYLDNLRDHKEIRNRALGYMMEGYQRQLSYQRDDGSFSAFGARDTSGSTWLTAFVLRCFLQAQRYMQVDQSVLTRATTWLLNHQGPQGEFSEVGRLISTEMQGGLDGGSVGLTAYVLMALLEDDSYVEMYPGNVSLAQSYLENKVSSRAVVSNYSLSLVAYALALAGSPVAGTALDELSRRADYRDGVMMWGSSAGLESHAWQTRSAQIEMASYVLLAFYRRGSLVEGIELMKWLSKQRNHLGGYGTTQDTVVALQALAFYATFSGANAIDLRLSISDPASSFVSLFSINSSTYLTYKRQEINSDKDLNLHIYMEGRGFAIFQMNVFYNLETKAFSQNLQHAKDEEAFSLDVDVTVEIDHNHMLLSICTGLKDSQVISHTGMVILDVGMLSGFSLAPGAAALTDLIRNVEILPEKVSLYLDSLNKSEVCIRLPFIRDYKVGHVQDAVVRVFDYYEPTRRAKRAYNSEALHNKSPWFFCGENCDLCRPGITITVPSMRSHSVSSATYSFICVCLGVAASFMVV